MSKLQIDQEFMRLIPPLTEEEYRQLEANILAKGKCENAIMLWDGLIVDGHNRFYICVEHGIEFEMEDIQFASREEAKLWILENQLGRRNLTDAARIELALSKAEILREMAKERQSEGGKYKGKLLTKSSKVDGERINVQKTSASEAGVGQGTLQRYEQIKNEGSPALLEAVKSGELKIGTAYRMLPKELEKQLKEVDKMYENIAKHLPQIKGEEMRADVYNKLLALREQLLEILGRGKSSEIEN